MAITDSNAEVQTFHTLFAYICQDDIVESLRTMLYAATRTADW